MKNQCSYLGYERYLFTQVQKVFAMCITGIVDSLLSERYLVNCTTEIFGIEFDSVFFLLIEFRLAFLSET